MRSVVIVGVGMHPFGRFLQKSLKDLAREAVWNALRDAGASPKDIEVAYVSNNLAGLILGEEGVRGQKVLRDAGLGGIPIINVENACAGAATALRGAWLEVASGQAEVALALGVEKMYCEDTSRVIRALQSDSDLEMARLGFQFTALYALKLRKYMERTGAQREHLAQVVVKNSYNGSLNPYAQYRRPLTQEEVLNARIIADPLTLYMCSSIGDGAAAAVICSRRAARKFARPPVEISACALLSGRFRSPDDTTPSTTTLVAQKAYETAGLGPQDIDLFEVHDAMAPAELIIYEELGICGSGEGWQLMERGATTLRGPHPVNPSGGLAARGHPVGATGLAQVAEIVWQLRGEAGPRQLEKARVGLAQNTGGYVEGDNAASSIIILRR